LGNAPQLVPAPPGQRPLIGRLLQLYLHDFSEHAAISSPYGDVDEAGCFAYPYLDLYWREPGRLPFLIRTDGRIAGFVLVNQWFVSGQPGDHCVAEFFVLRKYRRTGLGTAAARRLFDGLPGWWEVPVAHYNAAAQQFWRKVLADRPFTECVGDGDRWMGPILRFQMS
jgi:predicted acetyltransferase